MLAAAPAFTQPLCSGCQTRLPGKVTSSCVLCKLTPGIDSTYTIVLALRTKPQLDMLAVTPAPAPPSALASEPALALETAPKLDDLTPATAACHTDEDCSLNGVCEEADGVRACVCDTPWSGPSCGRLLFAAQPHTASFWDEHNVFLHWAFYYRLLSTKLRWRAKRTVRPS